MCLFRLSRRPDLKIKSHSGQTGLCLLGLCFTSQCRRSESFLETPLNSARHPLYVHFTTLVIDEAVERDWGRSEAGGSMSIGDCRFVVLKVGSSNTILVAAFSAEFWLIPDGKKDRSTAEDCWAGKAIGFIMSLIAIKALGCPLNGG